MAAALLRDSKHKFSSGTCRAPATVMGAVSMVSAAMAISTDWTVTAGVETKKAVLR